MAWSWETVDAIISGGLQGSPVLYPTTNTYSFTGRVKFTTHTLWGYDNVQPLASFRDVQDLTQPHSLTVFTPDKVKRGIVKWVLSNGNGGVGYYLYFKDANENNVYSVPISFQYNWDTMGDNFYDWLDLIGWNYDTSLPTFANLNSPIYLAFSANAMHDNPNTPLGISWVATYTPFCATFGEWTARPQFVDNLGYASLNYQDVMNYIDELFEGNYNGHEGQIAPTGGTGGGGGTFYRPTYGIGIPSLPSVSVCDTGMVSVYSVTTAQLQQLGNYLWDDNFFNQIVKLFQSPMDNIITLQSVPIVSGAMRGTASNIIIGNVDTNIPSTLKLSTTYYEVNCGSLYVPEIYKSFADYNGYVLIDLVLPYIGVVRINPDDIVNGRINVVYHVDVFSGACVAFVNCYTNGVWTVLSEHSGNVTAQFPITGSNFASVYIGAINSIGASISGNTIGAFNSAMNMKPSYARSGGVTSSSGIMGIQRPYLIFSSPKYIIAENFRDIKGYTSNLKVTVGNCTGFLQATVDNTDLEGIDCTRDELEMIRNALSQGIYI